MILEILGVPLAKKRARAFLLKGKICHYNPQSNEERNVKDIMLTHIRQMFDSPIRENAIEASNLAYGELFTIDLTFCMPIPKSYGKTKRKAISDGFNNCNTKPDIDNLIKFYLDCANEILFPDDRLIIALTAKKVYDENPRTIINVKLV